MFFGDYDVDYVFDLVDADLLTGIAPADADVLARMALDGASAFDSFSDRYPNYCVNSELIVIDSVREMVLRCIFEDLCNMLKTNKDQLLKLNLEWIKADYSERGTVVIFDDLAHSIFSDLFEYWLDLQAKEYWSMDNEDRMQLDQEFPDLVVEYFHD